jgi:hypothetical protein
MRLFARQKLLLALTEALGGHASAVDFQKLLFLYAKDWEEEPTFQFVPYRFGCFSFQSYVDRHALIHKGALIEGEDQGWHLTNKAKPFLPRDLVAKLRLFVTQAVPERGDALVARTYRDAPFYASRSEIVERVIPDPKERTRLWEKTGEAADPVLFTIGYEGDDIDGYLNRLIRNQVRVLCDVRKNPLSRKPGFSKTKLSRYCERVGILYRHLPDLGIPGNRRRQLNSQADYDQLFAEYEAEDLPQQSAAVDELFGLLREHSRIALTCFEKEPHCCHRHCIAEKMAGSPDGPVVKHI